MSAPAIHWLIVGLIALLVLVPCAALFWHLCFGKGKHHAARKQPPVTSITPDMVKQKLAQIDLNLSVAPDDGSESTHKPA